MHYRPYKKPHFGPTRGGQIHGRMKALMHAYIYIYIYIEREREREI